MDEIEKIGILAVNKAMASGATYADFRFVLTESEELSYSDGVPEAMDEDLNELGERQMLELIELGKTKSLDSSVTLLLQAVERWCAKNGPKDDVSILGLEIGPQQGPSRS